MTDRLIAAAIAAATELERLKTVNERLVKALEFYADPDIVIGRIIDGKIVADPDSNGIARAVLAEARKP